MSEQFYNPFENSRSRPDYTPQLPFYEYLRPDHVELITQVVGMEPDQNYYSSIHGAPLVEASVAQKADVIACRKAPEYTNLDEVTLASAYMAFWNRGVRFVETLVQYVPTNNYPDFNIQQTDCTEEHKRPLADRVSELMTNHGDQMLDLFKLDGQVANWLKTHKVTFMPDNSTEEIMAYGIDPDLRLWFFDGMASAFYLMGQHRNASAHQAEIDIIDINDWQIPPDWQ